MKRFLERAKDLGRPGDEANRETSARQEQVTGTPHADYVNKQPTLADVTRYRYHHGTNLGSVFILEKWLSGGMFPGQAKGSSELAAAEAWTKYEGSEKAQERFERHWREYVSDSDLDWLSNIAKCTTVRVPIGYFTLGPPYCRGTPFEHVASLYVNAWAIFKKLVQRCHARNIGVIIDLHGQPGGANAQEHSGTNSGKVEFWNSKTNRQIAIRCLCFIAGQTRTMEGIAGIQIVNEAEYNAKSMYDWYDDVLSEFRKIDLSIPIYISDAWDLGRALTWSQKKNSFRNQSVNPVIVDTHIYWCFSDQDKSRSPQQIVEETKHKLSDLDGKDGSIVDCGAAQVIVGEYSCVLSEDSWSKGGPQPKEELVREFGIAESERFQQRAGGSFFWTYKMDWMPGGEWGFKNMVEQQAIKPPSSLTLTSQDVEDRLADARGQHVQLKEKAVSSHVNYWDSQRKGKYEHWRFEQGWDIGFNDAMAFFAMRSSQGTSGADKIGMLDMWCLKRMREYHHGQNENFLWEFEHGLRQGINNFYECASV